MGWERKGMDGTGTAVLEWNGRERTGQEGQEVSLNNGQGLRILPVGSIERGGEAPISSNT